MFFNRGRILLLVSATLVMTIRCTEESEEPGKCHDPTLISGDIELRIENVSNFHYENIQVNTSGGEHNFCDLAPGETSIYKRFVLAYRYGRVELTINRDTFILQPIDYVGEIPLDPGKHSYLIDASEDGTRFGRLQLTYRKD